MDECVSGKKRVSEWVNGGKSWVNGWMSEWLSGPNKLISRLNSYTNKSVSTNKTIQIGLIS